MEALYDSHHSSHKTPQKPAIPKRLYNPSFPVMVLSACIQIK